MIKTKRFPSVFCLKIGFKPIAFFNAFRPKTQKQMNTEVNLAFSIEKGAVLGKSPRSIYSSWNSYSIYAHYFFEHTISCIMRDITDRLPVTEQSQPYCFWLERVTQSGLSSRKCSIKMAKLLKQFQYGPLTRSYFYKLMSCNSLFVSQDLISVR